MLINLKALSEAKIFKKKKNSEARATSQTSAYSLLTNRTFVEVMCLIGWIIAIFFARWTFVLLG